MATFLAALNLVDILIFQRRSISRSPVFLSGFQLLKHLSSGTAALKARRTNQKMKGQAWRKVPSGISSPAPAFRSVGISQKSLPQILSHHPPVLPHPISKYLDTTWKLLEQYCLAVFKRKYSRLFFFLAASREHWQNKKMPQRLCAFVAHYCLSSIAKRTWG